MNAQHMSDIIAEILFSAADSKLDDFHLVVKSVSDFDDAGVVHPSPGMVVTTNDGDVFHVVVTRAAFPPAKGAD